MSDTLIKIIDLDELVNKDSKPIQLGKYKADLNEIPLSAYIAIKEMQSRNILSTNDLILERVIYPFLKKHNEGLKYDDTFKDYFTVAKIDKLWTLIMETMYGVNVTSEDDKKKE